MANRFFRDILIGENDLSVYELSENQGSPTSTVELRINDTAFVSTTAFAELGGDITGTSFPVSVNIPVVDGNLEVRFRIERTDAALGSVLDASDWSGFITTSGIFTETLSFDTAWQSGNWIRVTFQIRRTGGHGNVTADISVQDADSFVDVEFSEPVQESSGGSESSVIIAPEGEGQKDASGGSESTISILGEGGGAAINTDLPVTDGLVLDLDATKLNLMDGDPVSLWQDSSGGGNDATQDTESQKPTFKENVFNNKSSVRFDASNDDAIAVDNFPDSNNFTIFVVAKYSTLPSPGNPGLIHGASSRFPTDKVVGVWVSSDTSELWGRLIDDSGSIDFPRELVLVQGEGHIVSVVADNGTSYQLLDGQSSTPISYDTLSDWSVLGIGRQGDESWDGDISQVVVYNRALTTQEREDVENHLATKWGIDSSPSFSGGSESTVGISAEGSGVKSGLGANETTVNIISEGGGSKGSFGGGDSIITISSEGGGSATETEESSGGSEASILINSEGDGSKGARSPPSESEITITSEGSGNKGGSGGGESTLLVTPEGDGTKHSSGVSESTVTVSAEGSGSGSENETVSGGSESILIISAEGQGVKSASIGSEPAINIAPEGQGVKSAKGGSDSSTEVSAEGAGSSTEITSGGSETIINVSSEGIGEKSARGGSESVITISAEGVGSANEIEQSSGGSQSTVSISSEGGGTKYVLGGSESTVTISAQGIGFAGEQELKRLTFKPKVTQTISIRKNVKETISKKGSVTDVLSFTKNVTSISQ